MQRNIVTAAFMTCAAILASGPVLAQEAGGTWSGAYAGVFGSMNSTDVGVLDVNDTLNGAFQAVDISADGSDFGGLVGYNFQRGNLVYGVELSLANGGATGNSVVDTLFLDETLEWEVKSSAALVARVGTVVGKTLFFGSAGVAQSKVNFGYLNLTDDQSTVEQDYRAGSTFKGYVLGIGFEHALSAKMTLRTEVLHSSYSTQTLVGSPFIPTSLIDYSPSNTAIRVGLLFSF